MSATIETEQELTKEAFNNLRQNFPPHKVARLFFIWQIGRGDYAQQRDVLFAGETVESLFEQPLMQQSK